MTRFALLLTALATTGCAHIGDSLQPMHSSLLTADYVGSPQPMESVAVFVAGDTPPASCERVALLRAFATATVVDRLRTEAGRVGANAVDLRDFRYGTDRPIAGEDEAWNAIALFCPGRSPAPDHETHPVVHR